MFASLALGDRFRGLVCGIGVATALIACGCTQSANPSLIDSVRNADLAEKGAQPVRQSGGPDLQKRPQRQAEIYAGDDAVANRPKRSSPTRATGTVQAQQTGDGYQLNFENANLAEVTKVILGDTLKVAYFYDPRVQGQITLSTGRSVSREQLVAVLENALKMNNAVLVGEGGGYRVVPAGEAAAGDVGTVSRSAEELAPGFGVSVLPMRNIAADATIRLLESFVSKGGSLKAETTGNLLLIRGTARERQSLIEVAASFDVDWMKGQSAGIFPLTHSTPDELIAELNQTLQPEQAELIGKSIRFQPIHRLNAVLALTRQTSQLRQVAEWIRRLDRSNAAGDSVHVYRVENGKAMELANLLNDTLGTGAGVRRSQRTEVAPGRDIVNINSRVPTSLQTQLPPGQQLNKPTLQPQPGGPQVSERPLRRSEPSMTTGALAQPGAQTPDVRIIADETNNLILIRASAGEYQKILGILRQVDRAPLQVMINATIAEITLNDQLRYGVQSFLKGKNIFGGVQNGPELTLDPTFPGLNILLGSKMMDPRVILDALSDVTEVKVVSSPSIVVVDNQPALLKVGDEIPISTQQTTIIENPNSPVISSIRFRDTGVILKVIPRVNSNGLVTMDIEQEISALANPSAAPTLTPTISQRHMSSTISVYSGQMVALGGLISEQRNRGKTGMPIVNDIPVFGDLLGNTNKTNKRTELIVFIRPQVIRDPRDASDAAEELRSRLRSMNTPPVPERSWHPLARGAKN